MGTKAFLVDEGPCSCNSIFIKFFDVNNGTALNEKQFLFFKDSCCVNYCTAYPLIKYTEVTLGINLIQLPFETLLVISNQSLVNAVVQQLPPI